MLPRLALVSTGLRRDLTAPCRYFTRLDPSHFYRFNVYQDLSPADYDSTLARYGSFRDLYRQLVRAHPDVIQAVEPLSYYTQPLLWACYLAARRVGAALLATTHENRPLERKFGPVRGRALRVLLRPFFAQSCIILVLNEGARENVLACGAAPARVRRAMWGSWGVDTEEFTPLPGRNSEAPPTVLFVGRLHPEKGVLTLLDAFARVRKELPSARLVLVGDGPLRDAVTHRIRAPDLFGAVNMKGTVKHRDMPEVFHGADVFCVPSITTRKWAEQVGSASLQAMASGIPVVSTQSGAIPEYVPQGVAGLLVPENDADSLAHALRDLLCDPERANEMGRQGREYACAHYDARTNVQLAEQLVLEHGVARGN